MQAGAASTDAAASEMGSATTSALDNIEVAFKFAHGFVDLSAIHAETRDPWDRQPSVFRRLLSGRDVQRARISSS